MRCVLKMAAHGAAPLSDGVDAVDPLATRIAVYLREDIFNNAVLRGQRANWICGCCIAGE